MTKMQHKMEVKPVFSPLVKIRVIRGLIACYL